MFNNFDELKISNLPGKYYLPYQTKKCRTKVTKFFWRWQKFCPTNNLVRIKSDIFLCDKVCILGREKILFKKLVFSRNAYLLDYASWERLSLVNSIRRAIPLYQSKKQLFFNRYSTLGHGLGKCNFDVQIIRKHKSRQNTKKVTLVEWFLLNRYSIRNTI